MKRWRDRCALICGIAAALCLAAMMLITVADVSLRAFMNYPIRGTYEWVELLLTGTFFFALPAVFLRDENIVVNLIDDSLPRAVPWLKRFGLALAAAILAVMAWQGWLSARDVYEFNDVTADLGIPKIWHYLALLIGVGGACLAAIAMGFARDGRR
jgi:TRAP-type C4-dicarboxylate transport system permease small subunit